MKKWHRHCWKWSWSKGHDDRFHHQRAPAKHIARPATLAANNRIITGLFKEASWQRLTVRMWSVVRRLTPCVVIILHWAVVWSGLLPYLSVCLSPRYRAHYLACVRPFASQLWRLLTEPWPLLNFCAIVVFFISLLEHLLFMHIVILMSKRFLFIFLFIFLCCNNPKRLFLCKCPACGSVRPFYSRLNCPSSSCVIYWGTYILWKWTITVYFCYVTYTCAMSYPIWPNVKMRM